MNEEIKMQMSRKYEVYRDGSMVYCGESLLASIWVAWTHRRGGAKKIRVDWSKVTAT